MEKKFPEIGLFGVNLPKDYSAFLVVFFTAVVNKSYQCLQDQRLASEITGGNCMSEFKATSIVLSICHATLIGNIWRKL